MNTIKFNNTEFELESYNRNTYFNLDGSMNSNAGCSIITDNVLELNTLAETPITSLQIFHDEELIYNLQNINININSISEYLNNDKIDISMNMTFNI